MKTFLQRSLGVILLFTCALAPAGEDPNYPIPFTATLFEDGGIVIPGMDLGGNHGGRGFFWVQLPDLPETGLMPRVVVSFRVDQGDLPIGSLQVYHAPDIGNDVLDAAYYDDSRFLKSDLSLTPDLSDSAVYNLDLTSLAALDYANDDDNPVMSVRLQTEDPVYDDEHGSPLDLTLYTEADAAEGGLDFSGGLHVVADGGVTITGRFGDSGFEDWFWPGPQDPGNPGGVVVIGGPGSGGTISIGPARPVVPEPSTLFLVLLSLPFLRRSRP